MENIVLVGGGGHCLSCIDAIESTNMYSIIGIIDKEENVGKKILNYEIIGTDSMIESLVEKEYSFLITIGQIKSSSLRRKVYEIIKNAGGKLATIIASTAYISKYAVIGKGSIILHKAFVNAGVIIGENCIINTGSIVEHNTEVADFTHISTNSTINGDCKIGSDIFIGSNVTVNQGISIYRNSIIASGSLITKNVDKSSFLKGIPAHE
jgi:sugar O-acyltransferase (sialic acid O-acetyltransferase NeuD family)